MVQSSAIEKRKLRILVMFLVLFVAFFFVPWTAWGTDGDGTSPRVIPHNLEQGDVVIGNEECDCANGGSHEISGTTPKSVGADVHTISVTGGFHRIT